MNIDVFLSYSRRDQQKAETIALALEAEGYNVWWDAKIPAGKVWLSSVRDALSNAKSVVVLWSPQAISSSNVDDEAHFGHSNNKLIPAYIADCTPQFPYDRIEGARLDHWTGDRAAREWNLLCDAISEKAAKTRTPLTPPGVTSIEPSSAAPPVVLLLAHPAEVKDEQVTRWDYKKCAVNRWAAIGLDYKPTAPYKIDVMLLTGDESGLLCTNSQAVNSGRLHFAEFPIFEVKSEAFSVAVTFYVQVSGDGFQYSGLLSDRGYLVRTLTLPIRDRTKPATTYTNSVTPTGQSQFSGTQMTHANLDLARDGLILSTDAPRNLGFIVLADKQTRIQNLS